MLYYSKGFFGFQFHIWNKLLNFFAEYDRVFSEYGRLY